MSEFVIPRPASVLALLIATANVLAQEIPPELSSPGAVALVRDTAGDWTYVKFPESLPLYVFDGDLPGKSNCNVGCSSAWPPLRASPNDQPIDLWRPIQRDDGSWQWTFRDRPVYMRFHDVPGKPRGVGREGWRLINDATSGNTGPAR